MCILLLNLKITLNIFDFDERIKGSHHIYTKSDIQEILNLQPKGAKAKAYQVKQIRHIILRYKLADEGNDE